MGLSGRRELIEYPSVFSELVVGHNPYNGSNDRFDDRSPSSQRKHPKLLKRRRIFCLLKIVVLSTQTLGNKFERTRLKTLFSSENKTKQKEGTSPLVYVGRRNVTRLRPHRPSSSLPRILPGLFLWWGRRSSLPLIIRSRFPRSLMETLCVLS